MFQVYGQITLTFRYGREDEEVMGLKFCNEAVMCLAQLYPPFSGSDHQETTPLQVCIPNQPFDYTSAPCTQRETTLEMNCLTFKHRYQVNRDPVSTKFYFELHARGRNLKFSSI